MKKIDHIITCQGKWTSMISARWQHGDLRGEWEYIERNSGQQGVVIVPVIEATNEVLLIRQKRIPLDAYVIEFPAGLSNDGETIETCALRELKEETGAEGFVISISSPLTTSPGLTNECVVFVTVGVTSIGEAAPEAAEEIEQIRISRSDLSRYLKTRSTDSIIDAKVWLYATTVNDCSLDAHRDLTLELLPQEFSLYKLTPSSPVPQEVFASELYSITKTDKELSILADSRIQLQAEQCEPGWKALRVQGTLDFSLTGVLSAILKPLASAGISIFALSTFDTDYILVKGTMLKVTLQCLEPHFTITAD